MLDTAWDPGAGVRRTGYDSDILSTRQLERTSDHPGWSAQDSPEACGDRVTAPDGTDVWVCSAISWAVFLGCNTAARLAREMGIDTNTAGFRLQRAVLNKEIRWAGTLKERVGKKGGRPEHLYANISCKQLADHTSKAMRQVFSALPRFAPLPVPPGDSGRAKRLLRDAAERWAAGACTWWGRTVTERSSLVHVPHEERTMDQGAFEFILRTNFNLEI